MKVSSSKKLLMSSNIAEPNRTARRTPDRSRASAANECGDIAVVEGADAFVVAFGVIGRYEIHPILEKEVAVDVVEPGSSAGRR